MSKPRSRQQALHQQTRLPGLAVKDPLPIPESQYWMLLTQTQLRLLIDGIVDADVVKMARMIDWPDGGFAEAYPSWPPHSDPTA